MTAAAWTATPPPTATSTSVPYDLTVTIVDEAGTPMPGITIVYPASGSDEPVLTNEQGVYTWTNLPREGVNLEISAQGYSPQLINQKMERGANSINVILIRDIYSPLPVEVCRTDETQLYLEDFQDGQAPDWPEINLHAQGWNVVEYPEEPGNKVASFSSQEHAGANLQNMNFPEAVWRIRFRVDGQRNISFNWQQTYGIEIDGQHVDDSRYQLVLNSSGTGIRRLTLPVLNIGVSSGQGASNNAWHNFEASSYQGEIQVWIDGTLRTSYIDPQPLPAGSIGLELLPPESSATSTISFDNISVCGLKAPFVSLYTPPQ